MSRLIPAIALGVLLGWGALSSWRQRALEQPPGVVAPHAPEQVDLVPRGATLSRGDFTLTTRAHYAVDARVISTANYRWDEGAQLAPVDLAVGWGRMSDTAVLERIRFDQSNRFLYWQFATPPIPVREIERSAANMHIIPASDAVLDAVRRLRPGQRVHLTGFLVDARRADGWQWRTSMRRDDVGDGACELVYVESIEPVERWTDPPPDA